jgi:phosphatidylinositol alpha-1,6-mannosyltransferase
MPGDTTSPAQAAGSQTPRLRVLVVTRNLPPLIGGMERLLLNLTQGVARDCDVTVIGPRGCEAFLPASICVREAPAGVLPFLALGTAAAIAACRQQPFDLVIGGSGVVAPVLAVIKRMFHLPTLLLLHGLDIVFDHTLYRGFFLPCIRRADRFIVNSKNTRTLAIAAGLSAESIDVINPGTELPPLPGAEQVAAFKRDFDIPFEKFVVFVGRITPRKGLSMFIRHCMPTLVRDNPHTGLVIVGDSPTNSLNKQSELDEVINTIATAQLQAHCTFLGHIDDRDLDHCFAAASLQVLPLIETPGDVEGFGMVAVEAAACGTPTVAFRLGGVADAIADSSGALITPGDHTAMANAISKILNTGSPDVASCRAHAEQFAWPHYHARVRAAIKALLDNARHSRD